MGTNDKRKKIGKWKDNQTKEIIKERTPFVKACTEVQLSTKTRKDGQDVIKTEVIESRCERISGEFCGACGFPDKKWRLGICNLATHLYMEPPKQGAPQKFITPITMTFQDFETKKAILNPIKQSKRGGGR